MSASSLGYGNGSSAHSTSSPACSFTVSPLRLGFLWFTFRYQDSLLVLLDLPIPHRHRPNSETKWSVISSGRSAAVVFAACPSKPKAVDPSVATALPMPADPLR